MLEQIGPYRILQSLGRGAYGEVYLAEQAEPTRPVALKVLRSEAADADARARLVHEARTLARLEHDGIARVYEAGRFDPAGGRVLDVDEPGGEPFIAMQYVEGTSIVDHTGERGLSIRERLQLVARVAEAVQHAHQRGVLHRDLKPANILVDGNGRPVVVDFGIARWVDPELQVTRRTEVGELLGTLPYMSPEQVRADPEALDTRSDVYSLGVVLYELLAGELPHSFERTSIPEMLRRIAEEVPQPLSRKVASLDDDIERIVAKALAKDKGERYEGMNEFAGDLRRFLAGEPIQARPPSVRYLLVRYAATHRPLVAAVAAGLVALLIGLAGTTYWAVRAQRAQARAEQQAAARSEVAEFLVELFAAARPENAQGESVSARTLLDRGQERIEQELAGQPEVRASLQDAMGRAYWKLGLPGEALPLVEEAFAQRLERFGHDHPDTLEARSSVGVMLWESGDYEGAEPVLTEVLAARRRVLGSRHPDTLSSLNNLGLMHMARGRHDDARDVFDESLRLRREVFDADAPEVLLAMDNLANAQLARSELKPAESLYVDVLAARRRVLGEDHPDTLRSMNNLAALQYRKQEFAAAAETYAACLESQSRVVGEDHPDTIRTAGNLAEIYRQLGKAEQAEPLFARVLDFQRRELGVRHQDTLVTMNNLAELYRGMERWHPAEALFVETIAIKTELYGADHPDTAFTTHNLACLRRDTGALEEARRLFQRAQDSLEGAFGADHPYVAINLEEYALLMRRLGDSATAEVYEKRVAAIRAN
ncbi:serine/threonine-protein kinase [Moorena bouillonii]|uniref:Protein kinase domain-containing protein n=1 Tax=Moorena bouillonii PNG TaxID=568701 RepID=A0A1U7N778_9CYAN|nr:serine/threonine-protein kinase [Moorena bouillonii]ANM30790.1 hypothetical protein ABI59_16210 [Acidobacteria bacterium Mor1]OLT61807.1 hypothetical protein BJP37_25045 [Moorena bouillonii PNG]